VSSMPAAAGSQPRKVGPGIAPEFSPDGKALLWRHAQLTEDVVPGQRQSASGFELLTQEPFQRLVRSLKGDPGVQSWRSEPPSGKLPDGPAIRQTAGFGLDRAPISLACIHVTQM